MVKGNKRKRPEEEKNTSEPKRLDSNDNAQLDLFDIITTHPKLTKQQKRDAKRSISKTTDNSKMSNDSVVDKGSVKMDCDDDKQPADNAAQPKLTKQQKRDAKRAGSRLSDTSKVFNTSDSTGKKQLIANSSVYKRLPILPPATPFPELHIDRFLNPKDKHFQKVLETCYDGFTLDTSESHSNDFHSSFETSFLDMEEKGHFLFDYTQPAGLGTKVARTFVTRCLVGEPGITYKYLGLRMFSYPWDGSDNSATSDTFSQIGKCNKTLSDRTSLLLKESKKTEVGSCNYNLTLINRCYPLNGEVKMKLEPTFNKEKCTVSWHADSTLEHYSSIAVYHLTRPIKTKKTEKLMKNKIKSDEISENILDDDSWRISLRVCHNAEGPKAGKVKQIEEKEEEEAAAPPPLAVPLPNKWSYYLLDDFNHHHQHSVLAGKTDRFASTHRVCRTDGHTLSSIKHRCITAIQGNGSTAKEIRAEQLAMNELEFEWIRQFYVQGSKHYELHSWWHKPLIELMDLWLKLSVRTSVMVDALKDASESNKEDTVTSDIGDNKARKQRAKRLKRASTVTSESYNAAIECLIERHTKREGWLAREKDVAFETAPVECQPMSVPFPINTNDYVTGNSGDTSVSNDKLCMTIGEKEQEALQETINTLQTCHDAFLLRIK